MFTVKHTTASYEDTLYAAERVTYCPACSQKLTDSRGPRDMVMLTGADGLITHLEGGRVYVMNEAGKTVSVYRMDEHQQGLAA